ncbi:MAG TPA: hypothetical protein VLC52_15085 [Anaerolineae bacterium]|nr:hypothetical protein [Anaerolineae bacterium]
MAVKRMLWELAQNVPLIAGFLVSFRFWEQGQWPAALGCMLLGSALAALVIAITEPLIFPGHKETPRAMAGNVVAFSGLMVAGSLYLSAGWSSWWTDLVAGLAVAVALALAQEAAARERFGLVRSLWLGASCSVSLLLIRFLQGGSVLVQFLAVVAWFTLVMGVYKEIRIRTGWIPATARDGELVAGGERG